MTATVGQALKVLGERFGPQGVDYGRWLRLSKRVSVFRRGEKPGQRVLFDAPSGAALMLAAAAAWASLSEVDQTVVDLMELVPRRVSGPIPPHLAEVIRTTAVEDWPSTGLLPGATFGAALSGLIEALAGPRGGELARVLKAEGLCVRVSVYPPPFGMVGSVSVGGVTQVYMARRLALNARAAGSFVQTSSLSFDVLTAMAELLNHTTAMEKIAA